jgi:hypothetical protein
MSNKRSQRARVIKSAIANGLKIKRIIIDANGAMVLETDAAEPSEAAASRDWDEVKHAEDQKRSA